MQNLSYPCSVQSVIQTDLEHPDCKMYREQLLSSFKDILFHQGTMRTMRMSIVDLMSF